jgi:myo-inositol-1(or 4)-monophosphatase
MRQGEGPMDRDNPMDARLAFAQDLARAAGALALQYWRSRDSLTVKAKGLQDLASEADLNTELLIRERLAAAYPGDAFLGEETGITDHAPGQGIWVVDPIDGTQPVLSGMDSWCVSLAFVQGGQLRFGVVYAPVRDELFVGGERMAATLNGAPVAAHPGRSLREGITGFGYSTRVPLDRYLPVFTRFLQAGGTYFRNGSGALMLCDVAAGRLVGYVEVHINAWDCLGAIAVIRAAGLRTNDFLAGDGLRTGNPVIAGNAAVFAELQALFA